MISTWDVSKPSAAKTSDRNLIKTNALAVHYGNITSKDVRLFAQVQSSDVSLCAQVHQASVGDLDYAFYLSNALFSCF